MQILNVKYLNYNKKTNCFFQEISMLQRNNLISSLPINIELVNTKTGNSCVFAFMYKDMNSTREDVYGWNYRSKEGIRLLIIND